MFCVHIDGGVRVWLGSWPNLESKFLGIIKRESSSVESLVESYVDFDIAYIPLDFVRRFWCADICPALNVSLGYQSVLQSFITLNSVK